MEGWVSCGFTTCCEAKNRTRGASLLENLDAGMLLFVWEHREKGNEMGRPGSSPTAVPHPRSCFVILSHPTPHKPPPTACAHPPTHPHTPPYRQSRAAAGRNAAFWLRRCRRAA